MSESTECLEKNLAFELRSWEEQDHGAVVRMLEEYLASEFEHGSYILPCRENAEQLWEVGYASSQAGLPTFVATLEGGEMPIGFIMNAPIVGWLTTGKILQDMGVYVSPEYRGQGLSGTMRRTAQAVAKHMGFEVIIGVFFHLQIYPKPETRRDNSVLDNGWQPYGVCGKLEL